MKALSCYLRFLLPVIGSMVVLASVFIVDPELVYSTVTGKYYWFHVSVLFLGAGVIIGAVTGKEKIPFSFGWPDLLVGMLAVTLLCTYQWKITPAYNRFLFDLQLICYWFCLRSAFSLFPRLAKFHLFILIYTGFIFALWGLAQLYGFKVSQHSMFKLTGAFYNPGPYSGFLAITVPVVVDRILKYRSCHSISWNSSWGVLYYFSILTLLFIVTILPAGMSRSAWLAAGISGLWVVWVRLSVTKKVSNYWKTHRKWMVGMLVAALIVVVTAFAGIYQLKKASADGRFFMWKITLTAIADNPLQGTGIGGFSAAYAQAQEAYFASGKASDTEKLVAGTPEYAFNAYLQLWLELGLAGIISFIGLVGISFYQAIKKRQTAACGALISLCIFALSSYPLQLPSFGIVLVVLLAVMNTTPSCLPEKRNKCVRPVFIGLLLLVVLCGSIVLFGVQKDSNEDSRRWNDLKMLHRMKAYVPAIKGYSELYPALGYDGAFLFEYAQCLSGEKRYAESTRLLEKAASVRADAMIYNIIAKNYQSSGNYLEAERWLQRSVNLLPEGLYPYYLLTKLYAEPDFYQPEKMRYMGGMVLNKEPKVQSTAIKEMRQEVKKLLKSI